MTKLTCEKCGSRMRLAAEDSVSAPGLQRPGDPGVRPLQTHRGWKTAPPWSWN